jgi:hypothetical protein
MAMSRKDYELIARTFHTEIETADAMNEIVSANALRLFADTLSTEIAKSNPNFDRLRFMRAAGADTIPQR